MATVGIDIGTTAVKAVAVDSEGKVLARARVAHRLYAPGPDRLEHDARRAWRIGPRQALARVTAELGSSATLEGVCVASMVPSLAPVDRRGVPQGPGLLYGDARGRLDPTGDGQSAPICLGTPGDMPDALGFVQWACANYPGAAGYWPAQAVAGYALAGVPAIDTAMGMAMGSMMHHGEWDETVIRRLGAGVEQLPTVVPMGTPAGIVVGTGAPLAGGTVDALCDQIVSGAREPGDVLVIFGATLVVWAVTDKWVDVPGLWTIPHIVPGRVLIGGPSNAGALFVDWARRLLRGGSSAHKTTHPERPPDPERVAVWVPYLRGERVPFHDPGLRAQLWGLDITHDPASVLRAAYEASGFVVRHLLELGGIDARRIVASGGGSQVAPWMAAVADATGLRVDTVAVPEGAAYGAAFMARMAAGLEDKVEDAARWAATGSSVFPSSPWACAAQRRYRHFLDLQPA